MPVFEAVGSSDPLGLWEATPRTVSFGLGDETSPEAAEPVYRVNLTANVEASNSALAEHLDSFQRMNAALDQIPARLDELVRRTQAGTASGVSFAVADALPEAGLENELLSLLAISDSAALGETAPQGVSFGLIEVAGGVLGQAKEKFEALLTQVNQEVLHFAWVETSIAGQLIARTAVSWDGNATTLCDDTLSSEQTSLHQRTLQVVSRTRNLKLRLLFTVAGGASKMATLLAAPGGVVLALPAVYHYVLKILEQVKQIQSIQS
jgi:hypothetical protein